MIPVSIITGFLGSGKTTLLNKLLQHASLKNTLVIINEFGEIGIDHLLVSAPDENVRLLSSGCLCCELRGDLVDTLTELSVKRAGGDIPPYDRILIETTGLADPVSIVQTIVADPTLSPLHELDTVIGVIDALHGVSQLASHAEAVKQIALSDVVLISKGDLVGDGELAAVERAVRHINGGAEVLTAVSGEVDPELLLNRGAADPTGRMLELERWLSTDRSTSRTASSSPHGPDVQTHTLCFDRPATAAGLATWLSMLGRFLGPALLRVKGLVNVEGSPYVVHAVQSVIHDPVELPRWPSEDRRTRVVFIVRGLERAPLERTFSALGMPKSLGEHSLHINPAAYARFVQAAKQFL
jgi:G3E family GTPase